MIYETHPPLHRILQRVKVFNEHVLPFSPHRVQRLPPDKSLRKLFLPERCDSTALQTDHATHPSLRVPGVWNDSPCATVICDFIARSIGEEINTGTRRRRPVCPILCKIRPVACRDVNRYRPDTECGDMNVTCNTRLERFTRGVSKRHVSCQVETQVRHGHFLTLSYYDFLFCE